MSQPPDRMVLDTNVVLDWLVFREPGVSAVARQIESGAVIWMVSPSMRTELSHMLGHARLQRWSPDADAALRTFDGLGLPVDEPAAREHGPLRCSDPDDQVFVDVARQHGARWLLTRDRALLKLARRAARQRLSITTPENWTQAIPSSP